MDSERKAATDQFRNATSQDDLLGVIADVERQLSSLRQFKAEREEERQRLVERETAVSAKERQLSEREGGLTAQDQALKARAEKLEAEFRTLTEEQHRAAAAAEKREADLRAQSTTLDERDQRLSENAAAISRERQALDTRAAELTEKESKLRSAAVEIDRERTRCAQAEKTASEQASEARAQALAAAKRAQEAEHAAESARGELENANKAQAAVTQELRNRAQELEQSLARITAAQEQAQVLTGQIAERDARIQELNSSLANATGKFREVSQSLKEQAQLIGQANTLEAELENRQRKIAELEARIASGAGKENASGELAALREQLETVASKFNASQEQLDAKDKRIAELEAKGAKGAPKEGPSKQVAALQKQIEDINDELLSTRKQNQTLRSKLERAGTGAGPGGVPPQIGEAIMTRWRRLRRMRELLQDQGAKLRQAGDALRGRYEQSEQLGSQREELLAARTAITETRKKLERMMSRAAKNRAVAAIFHAVGILAALGGISWAIAGEVAPATFVAQATIQADDHAAKASEDQLAEWNRYHESLLTDPALIEVAADRMGRRGIETLATPGALSQRLSTDLNHESRLAGQLVIELRGKGQAKTVRTLDTYLNALVSQANAGKERRPDGLPTVIAEAPNTLGGVLTDQRPLYALGIFGVGFGLTAIAGLAIWRRLAAVKVRFEEESQIDSILDHANWTKATEAAAKS